jgi:hypothetical protein
MLLKEKLVLVCLLIALIPIDSLSQNLQFHYDMGKRYDFEKNKEVNRNYLTTTFEMFKPDEYGSTFLFIDMNYDKGENNSISLAYWEIARAIKLPFIHEKLSATIQYNDGNADGFPMGQTFLGGLSYPVNIGFMTVTSQILYRQTYEMGFNGQITLAWKKLFLNDKLQFSGFFDIWTADKINANGATDGSKIVILTEPQLWYRVWKHLNIGGEIEISLNLLPGFDDELRFNPTLGIKWDF